METKHQLNISQEEKEDEEDMNEGENKRKRMREIKEETQVVLHPFMSL